MLRKITICSFPLPCLNPTCSFLILWSMPLCILPFNLLLIGGNVTPLQFQHCCFFLRNLQYKYKILASTASALRLHVRSSQNSPPHSPPHPLPYFVHTVTILLGGLLVPPYSTPQSAPFPSLSLTLEKFPISVSDYHCLPWPFST